MRRLVAGSLVALALAACGETPDVPDTDLGIHVSTQSQRIAFGAPFDLTVDRVWETSLTPEEWSDETLAPLVVREVERTRHVSDGRVLERREFVAHAIEMGDVRVLPPIFVATESDGETERTTTGDGLDLYVIATLDPAAPGELEFPPGPPPPERAWWVLVVAVGGLLAVGTALVRATRKRAVAEESAGVPAPAPVGPEVAALEQLAALREDARERATAAAYFFDDVSAVVRTYAVARFDWATAHATSEELIAAAGDCGASLRPVLTSADLARFARHDPTDDEIARVLDRAEMFVRETAS